jgi:hypothetical protein
VEAGAAAGELVAAGEEVVVAAGASGLGVVVAGEEVVVAAGASGLGVVATASDEEELDETAGELLIGRGRQRPEVRFFLAMPAWAGLKRAI